LLALSAFGRSLNVVSLAGLAFAVGLVLDAAIIVQENIVRLRQGGMPSAQAAREGPSQVVGALFASTMTSIAIFLPILFMEGGGMPSAQAAREGPSQVVGALFASTMTSIAIFLPILFMEGLEGQLFADLALTLSVAAVAMSMIAAITVLPVASKYFGTGEVAIDRLEHVWDKVTSAIVRLTATPRRRSAWIVSLVTLPALFTWLLAPKLDLDSDGVQVFFSMPEGIPLRTIENELVAEVIRRFQPHVDGEASPGIHGYNLYSYGSNATGVYIYPADPREADELIRKLREEILVGLPGAKPFVSRASLLNIGISGGRNIDIDLQGPELVPLMNAARVGQNAINERFSEWSVRALPGTTLSKPELQLVPDDIRITQAGLDRGAVADAVRAFTGGLDAGRHFDGNEGLDVLIWSGEWTTPEDLAGLPIYTPESGIQVIGELASIRRTVGPTQLRRVNGQRTVTLQVLPPATMTIEDALNTIRDSPC
jgi:multidrug efflux pump subunit AcrB